MAHLLFYFIVIFLVYVAVSFKMRRNRFGAKVKLWQWKLPSGTIKISSVQPDTNAYGRVRAAFDFIKAKTGGATAEDILHLESLVMEMYAECVGNRRLITLLELKAEISELKMRLHQLGEEQKQFNEILGMMKMKLEELMATKEFARVRLVLSDLNNEYMLEKSLRNSNDNDLAAAFVHARAGRNRGYFILHDESDTTKAAKTWYALQRLDALGKNITRKFNIYSPNLLPTVLKILHNLSIPEIAINEDMRANYDAWWGNLV